MSEWKKCKLSDLVIPERGISYGIVQPGTFQDKKGIPILKVNNLTERKTTIKDVYFVSNEVEEKHWRTKLEGNEILVSIVGTLGHLFRVGSEQIGWNVVRAIAVLPIQKKHSRDWIYWCLNSPDIQNKFKSQAIHTVQATLNLKELREIEIPMPEFSIQTSVAEILTSIDDKIELNKKINKNLEDLAQTLFKRWFIDFEFPDENGKPYKSSEGKMMESEFGEIPVGWNASFLGDIVKTTSGGTPSRSKDEYYSDGNIFWVKSKELNNSMIFETEEFINELGLKNSSAKLLPAYSILIAMYGATVGQFGLITTTATCNQAICAVIPNDQIPYSFLYLFFQSYRKEFSNLAVGSAQQNISQDLIKKTKLIVPASKVLFQFHEIAESSLKTIENNCYENKRLASLRDILLPKLILGQLEIKESKLQTT